uniref:Uncharacterized protein n=1 Tax=Brassica oleracea TaxID=3712 RepID=A0A3P6G5M1_BRAOL|nr:unnamed protein product [Brassica oleracea]
MEKILSMEETLEVETSCVSVHSVRGKWWPYRLLWFDDWLKMDKVIDITCAVGTCYLGVACNARNIRGRRSPTSMPFMTGFRMSKPPMTLLAAMWCFGSIQKIHIKLVFHQPGLLDQIRVKKAIVFWSKSVWFSQAKQRLGITFSWLAHTPLQYETSSRITRLILACYGIRARQLIFLQS